MEPDFLYYEQGVIKYHNRDYSEAITLFNRQILKTPEFHKAFLYLGHSKFVLGDITGACLDWKKSRELGNGEAEKFISKYCR